MSRAVFVKLAARGLARNLRRSLITLGAVAIGLAGLIFLWAYIDGINHQMIDNVTGFLTGHVQLHRRGHYEEKTLDLALKRPAQLLAKMSDVSDVAAVAARIQGEALASGPQKTRGVLVLGIDPMRESRITTLARTIKAGRFLDAGDTSGILLGTRVAEVLHVNVGDEVTLVTQAADGSIGAGRYSVRGTFETGINMIDRAYVLLTLPAAQALYALEGRATTVALRLDDIDDVPRTVDALKSHVGAGVEVFSWQRLLPAVVDDISFHEALTYIILFVVFVVVTLGIANTILMSVMERIREFGVMMALGTTTSQIARVVLYEALLLGVGGIVLGLALGIGIVAYYAHVGIDLGRYSEAMQTMPGLTGVVYPRTGLGRLVPLSLLVLVTTLIASAVPAWKAGALTPIEAIRGMAQSAKRRLAGFGGVALPLPRRALFLRIAMRNIARNPRRTLLTLGALGAGLAAYLFLSALGQGFFLQMRDNATDLLAGDMQIEMKGFRDELDPKLTLADSQQLLAAVRADPAVAAATSRLQATGMASSPVRSEPITLYGVDPRHEPDVTRLNTMVREGSYLSTDASGGPANGKATRRSAARSREIVIGRKLAERLAVRLGEKIVVLAPAADGSLGSAALRIVGIFETDNELIDGHVALTSLSSARRLLGVPQDATNIVARLVPTATLDATAAELRSALTQPNEQVVTWRTLLPEVDQMLELIRVNLYVILFVVFLVVALGVTNTLLMAVLERTREFGLQLALGTRPSQIVRTVLYESLVLAVVGVGVGIVAGTLIVGYYHTNGFDLAAYAAGVKSMTGMTGVAYPTIVLADVWLPIAALIITSIVAALFPAWRAARLDAVDAMRHV
jgi:putative ABC transport system permease protein